MARDAALAQAVTAVKSRDEIRDWLRHAIAEELRVAPGSLDPAKPFAYYGLDSLSAATLSGDLGDWLARDISPDLFLEHSTVDALSEALANEAGGHDSLEPAASGIASGFSPTVEVERPKVPDAGAAWVRALARFLVRISSRVDVHGAERLPVEGPALLACNHLHILDALWMGAVLPPQARFLVADEFRTRPVVGQLLTAGGAIFIERGRADRGALDTAVTVLRAGGIVGVAPEGRLSRTGGLIKGQSGIAYLSGQSGARVIPVATYGQERAGRSWLRLSRVAVTVRVGEPIAALAWPAKAPELERHTDTIMRALAQLLPSAYRGIYDR